MLFFAAVAWFVAGLIGALIWHTRRQDFRVEHIGFAIILGMLAPMPWMFLLIEVSDDWQERHGPIMRARNSK